ncbi:prealbumin-like fold domain-containing protein [Holdemanella sp.]|uniref:prealbumin-like fold domain-containing protein n=1 Tax=Holdemanella sp. TaxID=1971762 RepID=UPI00307AE2C6
MDELGENLQLDTKSIKVFKKNTELLTNCDTSYTNNTLEITIPNNVPIKITYTVTVNAKPDEPVEVSNTAYWKGYSKESGKTVGDTYSYKVGGGIEALSKVNFELTKQDQNNLSTFLQGAEFDIEKCELNGNVITPTKIATVTTDANGLITQDLDFDTLYKITETKAPDGYVLDNKPIYILDLKDKEKDTSYLEKVKTLVKDNKLYVRYKQQDFDIQVQNHKGEITVVKKFINDAAGKSTNPVSGTYTFGLYENPQGNGNPIQSQTITYNAGETQDKSVKFINLDLSKTYYVFELDDGEKPIVDSSKEVTINKLQYSVDYDVEGKSTNAATSGKTVTVTNKSRTKILPSTGSYGTLIYRISGAVLVLASLIVLTNINKKNHLNDKSKNRRKK